MAYRGKYLVWKFASFLRALSNPADRLHNMINWVLFLLQVQNYLLIYHYMTILSRVLQRNRTKEPTRYMYRKRFIVKNWFTQLHCKVPWSAICKLETQESWWNNSDWVQRPENPGGWLCEPQSEAQRRGDQIFQLKRWGRKQELSSFLLYLLLYSGPQWTG